MQAKRGATLNFRQRKWLSLTALTVFLLDYLTKMLALNYLADGPIKVLGNFLKLNLTFNSGAAFSLATSGTIFLSSFSLIMVAVIFYFGRKVKSLPWAVALGLVLGGIFGNLADRIFRAPGGLQGEVIDWIQIPHWPVFNIADTAVVSAAVLITYLTAKNIDFYNRGNSNE